MTQPRTRARERRWQSQVPRSCYRSGAPFALVASRVDPDKVYYAFQRFEGGSGALDVWCLGLANRCYRGKRAFYAFELGSFGYVQDLPINITNSLSDPLVLPVPHCETQRYLGPYHHVTADRLHSFHNIVGAELGLPFTSATLARGWVSPGFWSWTY